MDRISILFVCTGNICRSPTAEGVLRTLAERAGLSDRVIVASAGTHGYHVGEPPDQRSLAVASGRGYDLNAQRARRVQESDLLAFDRIYAMDRGHLRYLQTLAMRIGRPAAPIAMFPDGSAREPRDVPDPYYGGPDGFLHVLDRIETGCRVILDAVRWNA